jgi:hypothetical protein
MTSFSVAFPESSMLEQTAVLGRIKDMQGRLDALRGYL